MSQTKSAPLARTIHHLLFYPPDANGLTEWKAGCPVAGQTILTASLEQIVDSFNAGRTAYHRANRFKIEYGLNRLGFQWGIVGEQNSYHHGKLALVFDPELFRAVFTKFSLPLPADLQTNEPAVTPETLISDLDKRGVQLFNNNGKLKYAAPAGVLTSTDLELLRQYKPELLALLTTGQPEQPTNPLKVEGWSDACQAVQQRLDAGQCPDCAGRLSGQESIGWYCQARDCRATYTPEAFNEIRAALDRRRQQ